MKELIDPTDQQFLTYRGKTKHCLISRLQLNRHQANIECEVSTCMLTIDEDMNLK